MRYKINLNREKLSKEEIESHKDFDQFLSDYHKDKLYGKNTSGYWQWISRFWLGIVAGAIITLSVAWIFSEHRSSDEQKAINLYISFSSDTLNKKNNTYNTIYSAKDNTPISVSAVDPASSKPFTLKNKKESFGTVKKKQALILADANIFNPSKKLLSADTIIMMYLTSASKGEGICLCDRCRMNDTLKDKPYNDSKLYNKELNLNSGSEVLFETTAKMNTGMLSPHQFVHFKVRQDIKVGNETLIGAGSMASGEVIEITEAKNPRKELFIKIRLTAVDCHQIPLTANVSYQLLLIKQKGTEIQAGTEVSAFVTAKLNAREEKPLGE